MFDLFQNSGKKGKIGPFVSGKIIRGNSRFKELKSSILLSGHSWLPHYENAVASMFGKSLWYYVVATNSLLFFTVLECHHVL